MSPLWVALWLAATATPADAFSTDWAAESKVKLTPGRSFLSALHDADVKIQPVLPGRTAGDSLRFSVAGGGGDPLAGTGRYRLVGGIRIGKDGVAVDSNGLDLQLFRRSFLVATIGHSRGSLLSLDRSDARLRRDGFGFTLTAIKLTLARHGAMALNRALDVRLFTAGMPFGSATIFAQPREVQLREAGLTRLVPTAATMQRLEDGGVSASPIGPAGFGDDGISLPIKGGKLFTGSFLGAVNHLGGIRFSEGATSFGMTNMRLLPGSTYQLTAQTPLGSIPIAKLGFGAATFTANAAQRQLRADGVALELTAAAAGGLNDAFGTTFAEGDLFGTTSTFAFAR